MDDFIIEDSDSSLVYFNNITHQCKKHGAHSDTLHIYMNKDGKQKRENMGWRKVSKHLRLCRAN